jgi:predicted small secreted protein
MFEDYELEFGLNDEDTAFFQTEPEEPQFEENEPDYEKITEKDINEDNGVLNFGTGKLGDSREEPKAEPESETDMLFDKMSVTTYKKDDKKTENKTEKKMETKKVKAEKETSFSSPTPDTPKEEKGGKKEETKAEKKAETPKKTENKKVEKPAEKEVGKQQEKEENKGEERQSKSASQTIFDMNTDFNIDDMAEEKERMKTGKKVETGKKTTYNMDFDENTYFNKMSGNTQNTTNESPYSDTRNTTNESTYSNTRNFTYETHSFNDYGESNVFTEDDIEIIEDDFETEIPNKEEFKEYKPKKEMPEFVKKLVMFAAMFALVIGIPVVISLVGNRGKSEKTKIYSENTVTTEEKTSEVKNALFSEAEKDSSVDNDGITSSRFATLDELSLYIESNTGSVLSSEMQTVNLYTQGSLTRDNFVATMEEYISQANALNHLLLVNKENYENEGREEEYNELSENLDTLMIYGDMKVYNAENETVVK